MARIGEGLRSLGNKILGLDRRYASLPQEDTSLPPDPELVADMDSFGKKLTEKGTFEPLKGKDAKIAVEEFFGIGAYPVGKLLEFIVNHDVLDLESNTHGRIEYGFGRQEVLECFGGIARNLKERMKPGFKYPNAKVFREVILRTRIDLGFDPRASLIRDPSPERKRELAQTRRQQEVVSNFPYLARTVTDRADLEEALRPQKRGRKSQTEIQEPVLDFAEMSGELLKRKILSNIPWFSEKAKTKLSGVGRADLVSLLRQVKDAEGSEEVIFFGDEEVGPALVEKYGVDLDIILAVMFASMFRQKKIAYFDRNLSGLTYQELETGIIENLKYFDDVRLKEMGLENLKQLVLNVEKEVRIAMNKWNTSLRLI